MGAWDFYEERMQSQGFPERETWVKHTREAIRNRLLASPSCRPVFINGVEQLVSITHQPDMNIKKICALPMERLVHGGIVDFADNKWLITQLDPDNEIYERGLMQQCNYLLRWIGKDGLLKEKWCVVEDGTKYLIGEFSERIMSIGDARIAITIGKDEDTVELCRGLRFLIDDTDSEAVLAYQITKPNKLFNIYNGRGVFKFILNEVTLTDNDNVKLRIADYASWKPDVELDGDHRDSDLTVAEIVAAAKEDAAVVPSDDKGVWL